MANITSLNVAVIYRLDDSESYEFAQRYAEMHSLSDDQIIPVSCSAIEILDDYATFQSEVEDQILSSLSSSPLNNYNIQALVLMPKVPGGFRHEQDIISSTSRLSRINFDFSKKTFNPLYNRQSFKRYDQSDSEFALICSRFDSPLSTITSQWFDNTERAMKQMFVNGQFYFDAYSNYQYDGSSNYENELLFFSENLLTRLGLNYSTSFQVDPYVDPVIPFVENDSFAWTWGAERGSLTYFKDSANLRGFFYNADFDGAFSMRDVDERNWPLLSIRQGYVASAGAMSDPTVDGFLRPTPFFDALLRGATLGEAMLFSVPHLDWTMSFFGDPLLVFSFPEPIEDKLTLDIDKSWQLMEDYTSQSIVNIYRKCNIIKNLRDYILAGNDVDVALDLYDPIELLKDNFNQKSWKNEYNSLVTAICNLGTARNQVKYSRFYPKLPDYLRESNNKVTDIFLDAFKNEKIRSIIPSNYIEVEGSWEIEFNLEHEEGTFAFYHFVLEVSETENFDDILLVKDSENNTSGWYYEDSEGDFQPLKSNGLTSNYLDKKVKYINQSGELLNRGFYYYFRIKQKDQLTIFPPRVFRKVIYK